MSAGLTVGYFVLAFHVVFSMRLGPTAATILPGRGLHTGDALALPLVALGTLCLAVAVVCFEAATRRPVAAVVVPRAWERRRTSEGSRVPRDAVEHPLA